MRKTGLKALVTLMAARRQAGHINWTLSIALFSSIVTIGLVVLYFLQRASG